MGKCGAVIYSIVPKLYAARYLLLLPEKASIFIDEAWYSLRYPQNG